MVRFYKNVKNIKQNSDKNINKMNITQNLYKYLKKLKKKDKIN